MSDDRKRDAAKFKSLAHDIRNALTGVLGGLSMINLNRLHEDDKIQVERAIESNRAVMNLLSTFADMLGLQQEEYVFGDLKDVEIERFAESLRRRWAGQTFEKGIKFEVHKALNAPDYLRVNFPLMERIFANLIGNSIKFSEKGTISICFERGEGDSLLICLCDEGPGIPPNMIDSLFSEKQRPRYENQPGSGMGLIIVHELISRAGGEIMLDTSYKDGTKFKITFPAEKCYNLKKTGPKTKTGLPDLSQLKILIAEDNQTNQIVVSQMLSAMGARYEIANDGLEALEHFKSGEFDLALLDMEMPRKSGLEVIQDIRKMHPPLSQTPLIALTAYVMQDHREQILSAGADGLIPKPLTSIPEFGAAILDIFNKKKIFSDQKENGTDPITKADSALIDEDIFISLLDAVGPESEKDLIEKLLEDLLSIQHGLTASKETLSLEEVRSQTHILISVAGVIGAKATQKLAEEINHEAKIKAYRDILPQVECCISLIAELIIFIKTK